LRPGIHLGIGRLLAANIPADTREDAIFEIVSHFSRGTALITAVDERDEVAQLNLIAGKRAKVSTAYWHSSTSSPARHCFREIRGCVAMS